MSTTPSIAELRRITQASKSHKRSWLYRLARGMSVYVTWVLVRLRVTANQVTIVSIAVALLGGALLLQGSEELALAGLLLFWAYFVLDKVDGEIARYRHATSLKGICLDYIGHSLVPGVLAFSYGGFLAQMVGNQVFWVMGFGAAIAQTLVRGMFSIPLRIILLKYDEIGEITESPRSVAKNVHSHRQSSRISLTHKNIWLVMKQLSSYQSSVIILSLTTAALFLYDTLLIICVIAFLALGIIWTIEFALYSIAIVKNINKTIDSIYLKLRTEILTNKDGNDKTIV